MSDEREKFLSRWSRRKRNTAVAQPDGSTQASQADLTGATAPMQRQENGANSESVSPPLPPLPPVDDLTMASDFRGFFHPEVDEGVKRAALKRLFSDPHFNLMDGLDTYIDDYSKPDPLPEGMLAQMRSAQKIFKWARNELEEGETAPALTPTPATLPGADLGGAVGEPVALEETRQPELLAGPIQGEATVPVAVTAEHKAKGEKL